MPEYSKPLFASCALDFRHRDLSIFMGHGNLFVSLRGLFWIVHCPHAFTTMEISNGFFSFQT